MTLYQCRLNVDSTLCAYELSFAETTDHLPAEITEHIFRIIEGSNSYFSYARPAQSGPIRYLGPF